MRPYIITSCVLITYSGHRIPCEVDKNIFRHPKKIMKELIMDNFAMSEDPVINVEFKTKQL